MSRLVGCFILFVTCCVGCGAPESTVQGTVTIDGQLAPHGTVMFHPVEEGPTAYGTIAKDGSYSLRVGQGDQSDPDASGVPIGEYIVTAVVNMPSIDDEKADEGAPPKPGARITAEKYAAQDTSDLKVTVKTGMNVVPLELEGARSEDLEAAPKETATEYPADQPAEGDAKDTNDAPAVEPADNSENGTEGASDQSKEGATESEP